MIRESPEIKPTSNDPVTNYDTQKDKLIARIQHLNTTVATVNYKANNRVMWHYIYEATKDKSCFMH